MAYHPIDYYQQIFNASNSPIYLSITPSNTKASQCSEQQQLADIRRATIQNGDHYGEEITGHYSVWAVDFRDVQGQVL